MSVSSASLNTQIIDDLRAILGEDFNMIVEEQLTQARKYMDELHHLLQNNDVNMAMRRAHSLKSSVGQVGLYDIQLLAKDLELTCRADMDRGSISHHARELFNQIIAGFDYAVESLESYTTS